MSIADKITRLTSARNAIRAAITAKGVTATTHNFEDFATDIAAIKGEYLLAEGQYTFTDARFNVNNILVTPPDCYYVYIWATQAAITQAIALSKTNALAFWRCATAKYPTVNGTGKSRSGQADYIIFNGSTKTFLNADYRNNGTVNYNIITLAEAIPLTGVPYNYAITASPIQSLTFSV